ncbi:unnamed protein product, partial [Pleuronectes platessa]
EAEKRKQDMLLLKAEENRKKAEEKERVKQEKTEENRLNNERKLQLRRLALAKAKALKKPNEDMCLADLKHCHRCQEGDNEELLLLCHGCDKGCHTYCHRPKITTVPDGKWFCHICVAEENAEFLRSRKQSNRALGGGKRDRDQLDSRGSCAKKAKLAKDHRY